MNTKSTKRKKIPNWIRITIPGGEKYVSVKRAINSRKLNTVCLQARCPNIGECLCSGTATFMIMGNNCTRNCRYCAVTCAKPDSLREDEPKLIGEAVKELELKYAVITSVTRDDLPDGGALHFANTIKWIKKLSPNCGVEILVPDFRDSRLESIKIVLDAKPDIFNHNIEVAKKLFPEVRPEGSYTDSLELLKEVSSKGTTLKSGMMVGLGESIDEIYETMQDLKDVGVEILTVGQYLRSSKENLPVVTYYTPSQFDEIKERGLAMGFKEVISAPMVRSSYHAKEASEQIREDKKEKE